MALLVALGTTAAVVTASRPARAINPARHLVCERDTARRSEAPVEAAPPVPLRVPVPKTARRETFDVDALISIDVPSREPFPFGPKGEIAPEEIALPAPPRVASRNDFRCIGFPRGTAGILRTLASPPNTRFARHPYAPSWIRDNMEVARLAAIQSAVPLLRRELARATPAAVEDHDTMQGLFTKSTAIRALAGLSDAPSVPAIRAFLEAREGRSYPSAWEESLASLAELDPAAAEAYALDAITRVSQIAARGAAEDNVIRHAILLVRTPSPRAVATLTAAMQRLGIDEVNPSGHAACLFLAARLRAGDEVLLRPVRAELSVSLTTNRGVNCYSELVAAAFPGASAVELDTLFLRERYEEIVGLVVALRAAEKRGASFPDAAIIRRRVGEWLARRRTEPDIAAGRGDTRFSETRLVLHLALGAALGDAADAKALAVIVADAKNDGVAPWIGAEAGLRLDLPGAADMAVGRLALARTTSGRELGMRLDAHRGTYPITDHVRVIDLLVQRGDPRFVLGLLDRQSHARFATFEHLSRRKPTGACKIVADAAGAAGEDEVAEAFWALTVLGDACRDVMRALASDTSAPSHVRGMAIEHLAMVRDAAVAARLGVRRDDVERFRQRARIIHASPE